MTGLIYIVIQAVLAVVGVRLLVRSVFSRLGRIQNPEIVVDIWGPIAIVAPMMVMIGRVNGDVGGTGWIAVGGPILLAALGLGIGLLVSSSGDEQPPWTPGATTRARAVWIWSIAGLAYLLLSVAHDLTVWTGQTLFAVGAVLLWLNTPEGSASGPVLEDDEIRAGSGMTIGLICAFGQGTAGYLAGESWAGISGAMMVAYAVMILAAAGRLCGSDVAVRIGGWAATFGLTFSLGLLSLLFMLPTVLGVFTGAEPAPSTRVAHGFGLYAFEAMGLLLLGPAAMFIGGLPAGRRRVIGGAVVLLAAGVAAWRLASMPLPT